MASESRNDQRIKRPLPATLITALITLGLAGFVAQFVSSRNSPTPVSDTYSKHYDDIIARLERLERRHSEQSAEPQSSSGERIEAEQDLAVRDEDMQNIHQRLARLEQMEQDRQEVEGTRAEQIELAQAQRRRALAQMAEAGVRVMSDPTASDEAKLDAWRNMRMNAADAWNDSVVAEAVRIGTTSADPQVRADIWRQAHANETHPFLLQPLLQAIANDPDRGVREEAAETLDLYLDQAGAREALEFAAEYDADPGVRQQAQISLNGPQGGF